MKKNCMARACACALILVSALLSACAGSAINPRLINDYKTEGFLDANTFQIPVIGAPDKSGRGLVERRESAMKDAEARLRNAVIQSLVNYCLQSNAVRLRLKSTDEITRLDEARAELARKLAPFFKHGRRAFTYYESDHTAIIVYRISRRNLKGELDGLRIGVRNKGDAPEEKTNEKAR